MMYGMESTYKYEINQLSVSVEIAKEWYLKQNIPLATIKLRLLWRVNVKYLLNYAPLWIETLTLLNPFGNPTWESQVTPRRVQDFIRWWCK